MGAPVWVGAHVSVGASVWVGAPVSCIKLVLVDSKSMAKRFDNSTIDQKTNYHPNCFNHQR